MKLGTMKLGTIIAIFLSGAALGIIVPQLYINNVKTAQLDEIITTDLKAYQEELARISHELQKMQLEKEVMDIWTIVEPGQPPYSDYLLDYVRISKEDTPYVQLHVDAKGPLDMDNGELEFAAVDAVNIAVDVVETPKRLDLFFYPPNSYGDEGSLRYRTDIKFSPDTIIVERSWARLDSAQTKDARYGKLSQ